ncbi:MAG: thiopurine S-methyltransferase [Sulfitobacter sp.]
MDEQFWQDRWAEGRIGFHSEVPNPHLIAHFAALNLTSGSKVFVPLCGKTLDLDWLILQGMQVTGVEFNEAAARAVFARLNLTPVESRLKGLTCLTSPQMTLWVGDLFGLDAKDIDPIDAIYDRAALVALPDVTRQAYCRHLVKITESAPQLLITYDYDQSHMDGPPFAVSEHMVRDHYKGAYKVKMLNDMPAKGPVATRTKGIEQIWHLSPHK